MAERRRERCRPQAPYALVLPMQRAFSGVQLTRAGSPQGIASILWVDLTARGIAAQ